MTRFRKGDRVRCISNDYPVQVGDTGTVDEDDSTCPYVLIDGKRRCVVGQDNLELMHTGECADLFIRRVYTHKDIDVTVDIDLKQKQISLVEQKGDTFVDKKWIFAHRELRYMQRWQNILDAMKYAIAEATNVLETHADPLTLERQGGADSERG